MDVNDDEQAGSRQRAQSEAQHELAYSVPEPYLLLRLRELEQENQTLRALTGSNTDREANIAQLREANEHLVMAAVNAEQLKEQAEAVNRRQSEFLAMLAHELRNPLSPISMAASLIERMPGLSPELRKMTGVIGRQAAHMAKLLDDLFDAARISGGKINLTTQPLVLAEVLQHAVEMMQPQMSERSQTLSVLLPEPGVIIEGNHARMVQIFTNLLANASKYTGNGGALELTAQANHHDVTVRVVDNGVGLAPEIIPYIFDLFTQGPRSLARSEGGLGIGLSVVRNLVDMHGGTVECSSAGVGSGSCFTVRLPRSTAGIEQEPPSAVADGGKRRVLVIEDNPDTNTVLAACLREQGHEVSTAFDGRGGLAAALDQPHDVIVCDIGLPGLDGLELIKAVRASVTDPRPMAIALTGYGQPADRERGMQAGFDDYLVKPVALDTLLSLIAAAPVQRPA